MTAPLDRLKAALADRYALERELGRGGMATVYLAEDLKHRRQVAIKVLHPELAAVLGPERFLREIEIAARLQHPHILPLLDSGQAEDFLYYVMPFVKGESLREKLVRERELPVPEAARILRDVADALAHAHEAGVIHRDIKPENVMLSGRHALVTDFGVAKAITEATGRQQLTTAGMALGTPAYMAPEQAAADPHTDHRADLYALGVLAYEMLTGDPPFGGSSPQVILSAHVTQAPAPVTQHREVPPLLAELVMKCLKKKPADRWQRAEELLPQLEAMLTPTGGRTPTETQTVTSSRTEAMHGHPARVAVLFGLASVGVLAIVYGLVQIIGLPDWVFVGAIGLLAVGLPIMLLTGQHERTRALARASGQHVTTPQQGIARLFTWRKSLLGGAVAFAGLMLVTGAFMAMRALGVGPGATLITRGVIGERDPLVVADFENRTTDSVLGHAVTEAFRIDLAQSPVVKLLDGAAVSAVLQRMGRDPSMPLVADVAREIAEREGAKAFVTGEIAPLGSGFVLSTRVVSTSTGEVLLPLRETATDEAGIIRAVDRLSAKLRERLGESLKTIRAGEPLAQVTTSSMEALRHFTESMRAFRRGDYTRAIPLMEAAIAADSTFAVAYVWLVNLLGNTQSGRARSIIAARTAFELRDRLPPRERYATEAQYFRTVEPDREKVIAARRSQLELNPMDNALNDLALEFNETRRYAEAESLLLRFITPQDEPSAIGHTNTMVSQVAQGKFAAAETTLAQFARRIPADPRLWATRADFAAAKADFLSAANFSDSLLRIERSAIWRAQAHSRLAEASLIRGRLADAERHRREATALNGERGVPGAYINGALDVALIDLQHREDHRKALSQMDAALEKEPLRTLAVADRPYLALADFYVDGGRVDLVQRTMIEYEREMDKPMRRYAAAEHSVAGSIAVAEGRLEDAVVAFRKFREESTGPLTGLFSLADAYDRQGNVDSALVYYEQFVTTPAMGIGGMTARGSALGTSGGSGGRALRLGPTYKRLGELYEQRANREKAIDYYNKFVTLWKDADPELQPIVREVRGRFARLSGEQPKR